MRGDPREGQVTRDMKEDDSAAGELVLESRGKKQGVRSDVLKKKVFYTGHRGTKKTLDLRKGCILISTAGQKESQGPAF